LIAATVICRIGANLPVFLACRRYVPLRGRPRFRKSLAAPLFRYGGWMTVTAVIGPILVSVDRLLIGAHIGLGAVAHYAVPYNLVTKLQILPASLIQLLAARNTPHFAAGRHRVDRYTQLEFHWSQGFRCRLARVGAATASRLVHGYHSNLDAVPSGV
jgi:O-antigen/teichoic acid export membrane protein